MQFILGLIITFVLHFILGWDTPLAAIVAALVAPIAQAIFFPPRNQVVRGNSDSSSEVADPSAETEADSETATAKLSGTSAVEVESGFSQIDDSDEKRNEEAEEWAECLKAYGYPSNWFK